MGQPSKKLTLLVSSVGGTNGLTDENIGSEHYSYIAVLRAYLPILSQVAEIIPLERPESQLDYYYNNITQNGGDCIHLAFAPLNRIYISRYCPTVGVIFWEYPNIPNEAREDNPRLNWLKTIDNLKAIVVHSEENHRTFRDLPQNFLLGLWKTPINDAYFSIPDWQKDEITKISAPTIEVCGLGKYGLNPEFTGAYFDGLTIEAIMYFRDAWKQLCRSAMHLFSVTVVRRLPRTLKNFIKNCLSKYPTQILSTLRTNFENIFNKSDKSAERDKRQKTTISNVGYNNQTIATENDVNIPITAINQEYLNAKEENFSVNEENLSSIELSGIVYTSILNSNDNRKNWKEILKGFLWTFRGFKDVTLVIKLVDEKIIEKGSISLIKHYIDCLGIINRPKVILIAGHLSTAHMMKLAKATTYYINLSHAEGQCLPLNEYLAAGRPALCPFHSSLKDYVKEDFCFIIDSHLAPTHWPQDTRKYLRTTWSEINMQSYIENLKSSYELLQQNFSEYQRMSHAARTAMQCYFDKESLTKTISDFMQQLRQNLQ